MLVLVLTLVCVVEVVEVVEVKEVVVVAEVVVVVVVVGSVLVVVMGSVVVVAVVVIGALVAVLVIGVSVVGWLSDDRPAVSSLTRPKTINAMSTAPAAPKETSATGLRYQGSGSAGGPPG